MKAIAVTIERLVDDHFPGFVLCVLSDAGGREHRFAEKVPVVGATDLSSDNAYPQPGLIACLIDEEWTDGCGRQLVLVSSELSWGVESLTGETRFTVLREQLLPCRA